VSYLAIRGHVGWLESLEKLPWKFMIYEGHEGESSDQFTQHFEELKQRVPISIAAQGEYADGDSDRRIVAILTRN
jgi:hypothetical protein